MRHSLQAESRSSDAQIRLPLSWRRPRPARAGPLEAGVPARAAQPLSSHRQAPQPPAAPALRPAAPGSVARHPAVHLRAAPRSVRQAGSTGRSLTHPHAVTVPHMNRIVGPPSAADRDRSDVHSSLFVAGREQHCAAAAIEREGDPPDSAGGSESEFLHVGVARALERIHRRAPNGRTLLSQQPCPRHQLNPHRSRELRQLISKCRINVYVPRHRVRLRWGWRAPRSSEDRAAVS